MNDSQLFRTVIAFTSQVRPLSDSELEKGWIWKGYDEGVRFACFRMMERLRLLAAQIEAARLAHAVPITQAQRALAQFHTAFREMQSMLLGLSDAEGAQRPSETDWSVRIALAHLVESDRAFYIVIHYTLERARSGDDRPLEMSAETFNAFLNSDNFAALAEDGPLSALLDYYVGWHARELVELSSIQDRELDLPSVFWEPQPMSVQFRLHRFESHLRQHAIQMEKTVAALGLQKQEAVRLVRLIFAALGEAEGAALGLSEAAARQVDDLVAACTAELAGLNDEIGAVLAQPGAS